MTGANMRISFVLPNNGYNGGTRVIGIVAGELSRRGHDVRLFVKAHKPRSLASWARQFLRTGRFPAQPKDGPFLDALRSNIHVLTSSDQVSDAVFPDADVVVATWWETAYWVDRLSTSKGAKVYFMQDYGGAGHELEKIAPTWALPMSFITLTGTLRDLIRAENPYAEISVMRNAVDTRIFHAAERERGSCPRIGFMYRSTATKGMDTALDALIRIRSAVPGLSVVTVSQTAPDLPDWIDVVRSPNDEALADVYRSCDLWLFPSRMEGFGLPIIEAMACRTPVVSTRVGAAPDLIRDGQNGFLVEVDDSADMAKKAASILTASPQIWRDMSHAAWKTVAEHTWANAVDVFEEALFRAAVGAGGAHLVQASTSSHQKQKQT